MLSEKWLECIMKAKLLGLALLGSLLLVVRAEEDEVEGENGEEWEDNSVYKCVIESCSGWRLNKVNYRKKALNRRPIKILFQLPDVKNFIYGDFESKYERTVFKKVPGAPPVAIFYTQSGKELERVNLEKFDRYVHVSLTFNLFSVCVSVLYLYLPFLNAGRSSTRWWYPRESRSKPSTTKCN